MTTEAGARSHWPHATIAVLRTQLEDANGLLRDQGQDLTRARDLAVRLAEALRHVHAYLPPTVQAHAAKWTSLATRVPAEWSGQPKQRVEGPDVLITGGPE